MINTTNEGSKLYLYSITSVAILGGLLFGYDTAVISGAEKGLEAFFLSASDFQYNKVMHGITSSSALIGCVLGGAISGIFASRLGRRNSLRLAAVLFFLSALGSYYPEVLFFEYGKPNMDLLIAFNLYRVLDWLLQSVRCILLKLLLLIFVERLYRVTSLLSSSVCW